MKNFIEFLESVREKTDNLFYHGTGELKMVKKALETNEFKPFVSCGVNLGIFITPDKKISVQYAEMSDGNDKGIIEFSFIKEPKLMIFDGPKELYDYQKTFSMNQHDSIFLFKQHLLSEGYDGYKSNDVILVFDKKINILKVESIINI